MTIVLDADDISIAKLALQTANSILEVSKRQKRALELAAEAFEKIEAEPLRAHEIAVMTRFAMARCLETADD